MVRSAPLRTASLAILALALLAAPMLVNQGLLFLVGLAVIQSLFALSWNFMFRYGGLASFGHAMFYGAGAYTVAAILFHKLPIPFLGALAIATAVAGLAAFVVGLIVLKRTTGIQLAVLTLALSQLALLFVSYSNRLGRDDGLSGLSRPRIALGPWVLNLTSLEAYYYFLLAACAAATALLLWFVSGRTGRALLAVRIDGERAAFLGIDVQRRRVQAFTIAGAVAGFAGGLVAPWSQIVSTDSMSWLTSAQPMLATLLGGAGSFWGPVIGAFALTFINYFTRTFVGVSEVMVGGILLLIVLVAPSGIAGLVATLSRAAERRRKGAA
jgi:branched-chain amino acid transport system permease protein